MAEKILNAEQIEQLISEIMEATVLINNAIELHGVDEAPTAHSVAMEELARKAGWLLDRCVERLGGFGVRGSEWTRWCGGAAEHKQERHSGEHHA